MRAVLTILSVLFFFSLSTAQSELVDQATESLKNEKYQEALDQYQKILDQGSTSAELHYNMGVASAKLKKTGYALWHFLKAQSMGMATEGLEQNIQLVKESRIDEVEEINPFFLSRWWRAWRGVLGANTWSLLAIMAVILGVYGLYTWRMHEERQLRKVGFLTGVLLVLLSGLFLSTAISSANAYEQPDRAILLTEATDLKAGADANSASILSIHAGLELHILDEIGTWKKVRMKNGQIGWIESRELGLY